MKVPARPVQLTMPSPETFGLMAPSAASGPVVDWRAFHEQLDNLSATSFHLERPAQGGFKLSCFLPTNQPGHTHRVEVQASGEAEAVRLLLAKAQECVAGR